MTDNTLENQGQPGGTGGAPSQPVQPGKTPADSGGGFDQEAVLKELSELRGLVRSLQSGKDKGVQKALNKLENHDELLERYDKLLSKLDPDEAKFRLRMERFMADQDSGNEATPVPAKGVGGTTPQPASVDHTALLVSLGLDPNSAEVLGVIRATDDYTAQVAQFAALAAQKKSKPAPQPNPAQQVPVGGGSSLALTTSDLDKEYREAIKGIPLGQKGYDRRWQQILAIRKKAEEAGVESPV